ncbi:imidazoleglycerol-phosphate dehydratase [bacterium]|nr:imidazoleglycerol-phosphate dehydratase [bacterium]|tara:strand:+ start:731 stop:1327 length:597 start_codon:yes stop_codon:yes gene_type:complete
MKQLTRKQLIKRTTNETKIELLLTIDGTGQSTINTGIPFFDHMLDLFARHGLFDLQLTVNGDLDVDYHHSVEDVGICLGQALHQALGDCAGITRFADVTLPMDDSLCQCVIDISNRSYLKFNATYSQAKVGHFDTELVQEFFQAFVNNARINLHLDLFEGGNTHHQIEACFKAFAVCLDKATLLDSRKSGIPSTKGVL